MTRTTNRRPVAPEGLHGEVRVGVYVRRSTDDEHQPYSIEAQDTRLAAYIGSQPGWRQAARFTDDALNPEDLASRLAQRNARSRQLAARRDELDVQDTQVPAVPPPATLQHVADNISEVIRSGSHNQRKALIETLVAQVKVTAPDRIVPVFRIPQPEPSSEVNRTSVRSGTAPGVRAMANLMGRVGLEPTTGGL